MVLEAWPPKGDGAVLLGGPSVEEMGLILRLILAPASLGSPRMQGRARGVLGKAAAASLLAAGLLQF